MQLFHGKKSHPPLPIEKGMNVNKKIDTYIIHFKMQMAQVS